MLRITQSWGAYRRDVPPEEVAAEETEDECIEKRISLSLRKLSPLFPTGAIFSEATREALIACMKNFGNLVADDTLMCCVDARIPTIPHGRTTNMHA